MSRTWLYTTLGVALLLVGVAGLLSIGLPFLLTGLVMLFLLPWRRRRDVLWPSLASVWGLTLGYLLIAPLGCATSIAPSGTVPRSRESATTCNGLFFDYSGSSSYDPPLLPALLVGVVVGVAAWFAVKALLTRRATTPGEHGRPFNGGVASRS
jgi:lysylphosphatidylglycerol synthetase-like protein (DUF2156 family)